MGNIRRAPRWKVILHAIRIFNDHLYEGMIIDFDDKTLYLAQVHTDELFVLDAETGEILVIYTEDGTPTDVSDWMADEMRCLVGPDYPMYDYN